MLWKCLLYIINATNEDNSITINEKVELLCLISLYDWCNVKWSNTLIRENIKNIKTKLYVLIIIIFYLFSLYLYK